ncbi:MAG: hypothetical protein C4291_04530 [Candidatus Dadabacteria bacterium]
MEAGKKKDLDGVMEHFSIEYRDDYSTTYPVVKNIIKNIFAGFDGFDGKYSDLKVSMNETGEAEKRAVRLNWGMEMFDRNRALHLLCRQNP